MLAAADATTVETGEEAEETVFSCRAKLYHFEGKEWKERGVGTFKINTAWAPSSEESLERKSRLIMRTDGVHRVVLNTPIFKGMKVGTPEGNEPTGKTLNITGMEAGKPTLFALKVSSFRSATSFIEAACSHANGRTDWKGRSSQGPVPQDHGSSGRLLTSVEKRRRDYRTVWLAWHAKCCNGRIEQTAGGRFTLSDSRTPARRWCECMKLAAGLGHDH
jgi:hypothetical protein